MVTFSTRLRQATTTYVGLMRAGSERDGLPFTYVQGQCNERESATDLTRDQG